LCFKGTMGETGEIQAGRAKYQIQGNLRGGVIQTQAKSKEKKKTTGRLKYKKKLSPRDGANRNRGGELGQTRGT